MNDSAENDAVMPDDEQRAQLASRLRGVRERVAAAARRAGRDERAVQLIAVTKTVPAQTISVAYELGMTVFGENRVQDAYAKVAQLSLPSARWDLIGHLQSNKAAQAARLFDRIESVDSLHLAGILDARAESLGRRLPVLLEVNVAGEASKSGFSPDELPGAATAIATLQHLVPRGLMTVAPLVDDPERVRAVFRRLRELRDLLRETVSLAFTGAPGGHEGTEPAWDELSMGMSDDFEVAIEEGATLIRLGRALFGERPKA
ncbi:MAG TPA: YggS family pyridoxal phosphate-dependent enzyme [Ktedonobacterales bacterium]